MRWDLGTHSSSERYSPVSRDSSHSSVSLDSYPFMENPTTELHNYNAPYVVSFLSCGGMKSLRVNLFTTFEALGRVFSIAPSEAVKEVSAFSWTSCFSRAFSCYLSLWRCLLACLCCWAIGFVLTTSQFSSSRRSGCTHMGCPSGVG